MSANFAVHNDTDAQVCTFCREKKKKDDQRWHLNQYHGFSGLACSVCYDKIAHDAYGKPVNPQEFLNMVLTYL